MNKLEVSEKLNIVLDGLTSELEAARNRKKELEWSLQSDTQQERWLLAYQISLLEAKYQTLQKHIDLPMKARIKAMSETELEAYRQQRLAEVNAKKAEIESDHRRFPEVVAKLDEASKRLSNEDLAISEEYKEWDRLRFNEIQYVRLLYDCDKEIAWLSNVSGNHIRTSLERNYELAEATNHPVNPILVAAGNNREIREGLQELARKYDELLRRQGYGYVVEDVPNAFMLNRDDYDKWVSYYGHGHRRAIFHSEKDVKEALKLIDDRISTIDRDLERIPALYTANKERIEKIRLGMDQNILLENIDVDFIKSYVASGVVSQEQIDRMLYNISELDRRSKKIFKTKNDRYHIDGYTSSILSAGRKAYQEISKYEDMRMSSSLEYGGRYFTMFDQKVVEDCYRRDQQELSTFREALENVREIAQVDDARRSEIIAKVANLVGLSLDVQENMDYAYDAVSSNYSNANLQGNAVNALENEVTAAVMQESQILADKAEKKILYGQVKRESAESLEEKHDLVTTLRTLEQSGMELNDSQRQILDVSEKINPDKFTWYTDKLSSEEFRNYQERRGEREARQEEVRANIAAQNAAVEERIDPVDALRNARISELEEYKKQINMLGNVRDNYPSLLDERQNNMLDDGAEFFRMMDEASKQEHERDMGMSKEVRDWYRDFYGSQESTPKIM